MLFSYDSSTLAAQNQNPTAAQAPSTSILNPESETSELATKTKGRARKHLNPAGQSILDEYWSKNAGPVLPPLNVRCALLDQIKNCNNDWYEKNHITAWFKRHAASYSIRNPPSAGIYPSLTGPILDHLEVLIKSTSNPSVDVIKTWAALLRSSGAQYEDVINWVHSRLNQASTTRLPTPANTATPEPSLPPSSPKFDENHSNANMSPIIKQSPIASPNLLPNAYPSISRVPGHGPGTQMSPVSSPGDFKSANHRQRSASSDVSSMSLASPPFPPSARPPPSTTQANNNYMHHRQRSASSNVSPAPVASPPFYPSPAPPSSATQANSNSMHYHQRSASSNVSTAPVASPRFQPSPTPPSSATYYPNDRYRPFQQCPPSPIVNSPQFPPTSMATPPYPSTGVRNESSSHTKGPTPVPPPARTANSHPSSARPSPHPASPSQEEIEQKQDYRRNSVLQAIIEGFAEASGNQTKPPAVVPTSAEEYKAMFASYEKQLNHMKQVLEK